MKWLNQNDLIPFAWYKQQRAGEPAVYDPATNAWSVFTYDGVKRVHADFEHFSSQFRQAPAEDEPIESSILRRDPPRHKQMRTLVAQAFSARVIERMEPDIYAIANDLYDRAAAAGSMDVVSEYAGPLPVIVIAELLGIPSEDRTLFKRWSDDLVGNDYAKYVQCQQEMSAYFRIIMEERRKQPKDDLIGALVQACAADDSGLSELELIGFCILLLVAGNETTTNLISSAVLCLESSPEIYGELRHSHALIPAAIEETLRYCSPVQVMERRVKDDVEWSGLRMQAGQSVITYIGSANHDESVFTNPEIFDIRRTPNPHLAFGYGIHFCLGATLARLEARIALEVLAGRLDRLRRIDDKPLERLDSTMMFGVKRLPIVTALR